MHLFFRCAWISARSTVLFSPCICLVRAIFGTLLTSLLRSFDLPFSHCIIKDFWIICTTARSAFLGSDLLGRFTHPQLLKGKCSVFFPARVLPPMVGSEQRAVANQGAEGAYSDPIDHCSPTSWRQEFRVWTVQADEVAHRSSRPPL